MFIPGNTEVCARFEQGRGVDFALDPQERIAMHDELTLAGQLLGQLPVENSFAWSEQQPTRQSVWLASRAGEEGFVTDEEGLQEFDGDRAAGIRGLELMQQPEAHEVFTSLKRRADVALSAAALAIGVPKNLMTLCTTRYRAIRYSGPQSGIGTHFDGNGLSAVLTNKPGLREIGYDGQIRTVSPDTISVMPGSSVHRLSQLSNRKFLPTFHDVAPSQDGQNKTSLAAFWNFPDKTYLRTSFLDGNGPGFYHDVGVMKNDDGPGGTLRNLWQMAADAHGMTVEELVASRFPKKYF